MQTLVLLIPHSTSGNDEYRAKASNDLGDIACLESIRNRNINRIVIAHLNINSLRNKFESLMDQIVGKVDILMISETSWIAVFRRVSS